MEAEAYPAPDWVLVAHLRGPKSVNITAQADGAAHQLAADATETAAWPAGEYWYSLRATRGTDVAEVQTGRMQVLPDLAAAADGYDGRSENEIALDAIKAVLAKRASLDQERYRINNRELWRTPIPDLLKLRALYSTLVRRERNKCGQSFGRPVIVKFS